MAAEGAAPMIRHVCIRHVEYGVGSGRRVSATHHRERERGREREREGGGGGALLGTATRTPLLGRLSYTAIDWGSGEGDSTPPPNTATKSETAQLCGIEWDIWLPHVILRSALSAYACCSLPLVAPA